jgi:hypothetical protein
MRRSTVQILPLQLVFPVFPYSFHMFSAEAATKIFQNKKNNNKGRKLKKKKKKVFLKKKILMQGRGSFIHN